MRTIKKVFLVWAIYCLSGCANLPQNNTAIDEKAPKAVTESKFDGGSAYILSNDILFEFGKSTIRPQSEKVMVSLIADIKTKKGKVIITGHTDSTGSESYNLGLSIERAKNIAKILESNNVSAERIITKGLGESKPFTENSSSQSRQRNRRVEIVAYTKEGSEYAMQGGDSDAALALALAAGATILEGAGKFVSWLFGGGSGGTNSSSYSNNSYEEKYYQCELKCRTSGLIGDRKDGGTLTIKAYPGEEYKKMTPRCEALFGGAWYRSSHSCKEL